MMYWVKSCFFSGDTNSKPTRGWKLFFFVLKKGAPRRRISPLSGLTTTARSARSRGAPK
jgi:hypothetical protein